MTDTVRKPSLILGISAYYHDSAAALLRDGEIVAAAQEERFTRKRHDEAFPIEAIDYCLREAGCCLKDLDCIAYYEKPLIKFERLLETYLATVPRGIPSFVRAMPVWLKEKLYLKKMIRSALSERYGTPEKELPELLFADHHRSHAAAAFYPSPHERAAVLCIDGVGEWDTLTAWLGDGSSLQALYGIRFPHSLGLLYSAFTEYCGFRVNSGEYKLMGLAPLGTPRFADRILENLIDLKPDGSFRLDLSYFDYCTGSHMVGPRFSALFGEPARRPEMAITDHYRDVAASIQKVTEEIVLRIAERLHRMTGVEHLCLAGGVALNCVANGRLVRESPFSGIWVQPAAGDAGGALGAAKLAWHQHLRAPRVRVQDEMRGMLLGPAFTAEEVDRSLAADGARFEALENSALQEAVAACLADGQIVGWFQGRMEFGPRALGARSILADPRASDMQRKINRRIKYRESFRPFAPAVLAEAGGDWFELEGTSPYMTVTVPALSTDGKAGRLPATTHVDGSARVQTVEAVHNPNFHALLERFGALTGCPVLVNTSFNVRGEPIVCTPADAYRCFMRTEMDVLVIGDRLLRKEEQPAGYVIGPLTPRPPLVVPKVGELRAFGLLLAIPLLVVGLLVMGDGLLQSPLFWSVLLLPGVVGLISPRALERPFRRWLRISKGIGRLVNPVVLGAVYLLAFLPGGALMRVFGQDTLRRAFDRSTESYFEPIDDEIDMKKPY